MYIVWYATFDNYNIFKIILKEILLSVQAHLPPFFDLKISR